MEQTLGEAMTTYIGMVTCEECGRIFEKTVSFRDLGDPPGVTNDGSFFLRKGEHNVEWFECENPKCQKMIEYCRP